MAGRPCSICSLPSEQRERIDQALASGDSLSAIARAHRVTRDALRRHRSAGHVGQSAAPQQAPSDLSVTSARNKLEAFQRVMARAEAFMEACAGRQDFRGALLGAKTVHEMLSKSPDQVMNDEPPRLVIITQTKRPDGTVEEQEQVAEFPHERPATPLERIDWEKAPKQ